MELFVSIRLSAEKLTEESAMKRVCLTALVVIGFAAAGAQAINYDELYTQAVDDNWAVANNWYSGNVPDSNKSIYVGSPAYPNVDCTIYSGTSAEAGALWIGGSDLGSLLIEAGATLTGDGQMGVGNPDNMFSASYIPVPVPDENDWIDGGTGTLTINGTVSWDDDRGVSIGGNGGTGTCYLNSGGFLEVTYQGEDLYVGMHYEYDPRGYGEFYHADGASVSVADNINMSSGFYKISGGTITVAIQPAASGGFRVWNGTFWIDGDATLIDKGTWSWSGLIDYMPDWDGGANDTPTLRFTGNNPKLTVKGKMTFTGGLLDVDANTLTIPGWQWVTVLEANEIGPHTDWQYNPGTIYGGNDLTFAPSVDANIWSMQLVSDTLQIKVSRRGDMDKDSKYTVDDINPFVLALTDPNAYLAAYGVDPNLIGDCDYSGKLDTDDISPFVAFITGGAKAVPEPACVAILAFGAAAVVRRRRRT